MSNGCIFGIEKETYYCVMYFNPNRVMCLRARFVCFCIHSAAYWLQNYINTPPLRVNRCEIGENSVFGHSFTSYDHDLFYFIFYPVLFLPIFGWIGRLGAFIQRTFFTFRFAFKGVNYTFCPQPNFSNPSLP